VIFMHEPKRFRIAQSETAAPQNQRTAWAGSAM
jgi:hypothetical protein